MALASTVRIRDEYLDFGLRRQVRWAGSVWSDGTPCIRLEVPPQSSAAYLYPFLGSWYLRWLTTAHPVSTLKLERTKLPPELLSRSVAVGVGHVIETIYRTEPQIGGAFGLWMVGFGERLKDDSIAGFGASWVANCAAIGAGLADE